MTDTTRRQLEAIKLAQLLKPPKIHEVVQGECLTQIAYQKWVSLFMLGMEGWTEVRRTGVPALVPGPNAVLTSMVQSAPLTRTARLLPRSVLWRPRGRYRGAG